MAYYQTDNTHLSVKRRKAISILKNSCRSVIGLAIISALASNVMTQNMADVLSLGLILVIFFYTLATWFINHHRTKAPTLIGLIICDSLITGLVISELQYNPWPSLVLISLIYFSSLYYGGIKDWAFANLGLAAGIGIGFFVLGLQSFIWFSEQTGYFSIAVGAIIYMCIYSFFNHRQVQDIDAEHKVLVNEIKKQKLRIYQISQYLPKSVWDIIEDKRKAKIQRKPISIFFSDIVGFSNLSEELEAEVLSDVLSSYLAEMSNVVTQFNGTIDKFIGDAIMITFGDDSAISLSVKQDATACVSMAIAMGKRMRELQHKWSEMGINKPLQIRMGINTGYCTVGTFGTSRHLDHTALGVHVNLASRLESAAQAEEILISHETWNLVKDSILCKDRGQIKAKGFTHPIQVYQVVDHRKEMGAGHSYFSQTADGFSMHLDVEKVKNYDREKVIASLEAAATKLKE
ncbi:MAG: class 3 adenylate cyclase/branched-subunit amino acid transport protein AzlD [Granulosicoccus sp.]|jgi:class 3 adenylate cyclase/branched-subunit amino acid transport protein AzlD